MNIGFLGLGKLGLPCALAVESKGHKVGGYDISETVKKNIEQRKLTYKEEGANELLQKTSLQLLSIEDLVRVNEIIFIAIQTPHEEKYEGVTRLPKERIDFNYDYLEAGVKSLSEQIALQKQEKIVIIISTVLPGTFHRRIQKHINSYMKVCYNPFFIAMGTTIQDFLFPEFVLLGSSEPNIANKVEKFYNSLHNAPVFKTTIESAELIKVAYNTYISMKIVFANTMMEICHKTEANIDAVTQAIGMANRRLMSDSYLSGGMGDGGGCHPRDNIALSWLSQNLNLSFDFFETLMLSREKQTEWFAELMESYDLPKVILGKTFKPETNIIVGSPSILLKNILEERGNKVIIYDPHIDDIIPEFQKSVFFIGTKHQFFCKMKFPVGSVVIDPWRYIPEQEGIKVVAIGK